MPKKLQKRAAVLKPSQLRHLLRVTETTSRHPERDAVILLLGITCGMRITEIAQITVADVLFANGKLRHEVSLRAAITKGCRQRCIYLSSAKLIEALQRYLDYRVKREFGTTLDSSAYLGLNPGLALILSRTGYPFSLSRKRRTSEGGIEADYWAADALQAYVSKLYQLAGTKGTSHSGRRTFATQLLLNGASIDDVCLLLGHADIDQTSRYIDVSHAELRRAIKEVI
ncbi:tyrosine-type recombinase/integrase [Burkholderia sp. PAMC 26561]|uniref:tyrosine-type recombinase/integrase n=1 Tax=Burkholderia sp. PAMC 26561 TaxID=1795043 RepID=UPI00076B5094|nr:site-specific integrase [Burkholderia sp. PAMC 26561]AME28645.1 integrase [Burkholderia sp. PAMC 26561]